MIDGYRYFGYEPAEGSDHAAMAREHAAVFLEVIKGEGFAEPNPGRCSRTRPACCGSSRTRPAARPHLVGRRNPSDRRVDR